MRDAERLWASTRPSTLTDEERTRARLAIEQQPAILEALYAAALGTLDHGDETIDAMLTRVRGWP